MLARTINIPADVDRDFRAFLVGAAPKAVGKMFKTALDAGPMPNGATRAAEFYGFELHDVIMQTVPVIDEIEWLKPGFKKWLDGTGFGNDRRMIAAFAKWAEIESRGEIRLGLHEKAKH